jgi:type I restriction enzyme S subunit
MMDSGSLPCGWKWVSLEDVAIQEKNSIVDGPFGSNLKTSDYIESGVPVLQGKNITGNSFRLFDLRYVSEDKANELSRSSAVVGDILIIKIGSIGYSAEISDLGGAKRAIIPANLVKASIDEKVVYKSFLLYWLKHPSVKNYFRRNATKTAQPALSLKKIKQLPIPLPPLPIQKQIAAVLEKADTLHQQSQQMEQELNSLAQSVFLDKFGDAKSNPKRWQKRPLKSILEKLVGGKSLAAPEQQTDVSEYRVLKISAVTSGQYNPLESKALPADYIPPKEHFVQVNDLLFSRANTTELVGATTMVFDTPENLLLPDKLWKFQWKESEPLSQIFMWKLLSSKAMRHRLSEISSGSGGSMKNISKSKLLELEVIFPDYDKQMEYENFYLRLRDQMLLNKEYISQAEGQFKSIMQRAFKGELEIKDLA